eukprot:scaffold230394_cov19-Tisochrysis_lutea.AAC.1
MELQAMVHACSLFHAPYQVTFIPEPALWDAQGMRMALEDPRHSTEAVAELEASLTLHAPMPPMPILPVATPPEKSGRKSPMANSPARSK